MSLLAEYNTRPEEVGEILVKVQEDLVQLKERLLTNGLNNNNIDITALENAIAKTEEGIQNKSELVLRQLNNQVLTLPALDAVPQQAHKDAATSSSETIWDLRPTKKGDFSVHRSGADRMGLLESRDMGRTHMQTESQSSQPLRRQPRLSTDKFQMTGASPGQQVQQLHKVKVINNPHNPRHREVLSQDYRIQLPLIDQRKPHQGPPVIISKGSTVDHLAVLPRANRIDPQLLPPPITENDAKKGILSLIERGLIPPAAELTLDPSPVRHRMAPLHNPQEKSEPKKSTHSDTTSSVIVPYKLDSKSLTEIDAVTRTKTPTSTEIKSRVSSGGGRSHSAGKLKTPVAVKTIEMALQPLPPPTTPASAPDFKDKQHRFAIQHGRTRESSQEFLAFKHHYCLSWGGIVSILRHLERVLTNFAVPIAFINGDRLADLSLEFELERPPTIEDLLTVIVNREDVEGIIHRPGRRYMGPNGKHVAASKIQATFKMYCDRQRYLEYRRKKWAAGVIAISWVMHVKISKVRKALKAARVEQLENFRKRARTFAKNWDRICSAKRVVIHIPSLGHSKTLRESITDFNTYQNMQMARLCDTKDPNVDVIYVSPVAVNEEMNQYYAKLLGLKQAIDSGNTDDQGDLSNRYKIITPESIKSFPTHRMCLSTILKYSPKTLKRLRNLIRGREAFIVTGVPHHDDLYLSDYLNVPLLAPEPNVAHLYSTKSGCKRIFDSAGVLGPPGEYDVYSLAQLHECLAQLIVENLEVTRWLFKLDDEFDGRGIAYIDVVEYLPCYTWAVKEARRYGEKWSKKWAQEAAYIKIHGEIPDVLKEHGQPSNKTVYASWDVYMKAFLAQGGIIEACPPSDSVTAISADGFIAPNGRGTMVCCGDQIHADSALSSWGVSMPQSSIEPEVLNEAFKKVMDAAKARGILGYFTLDFVTFIHPKTMKQELWVVDLSIHYSDTVAMFTLTQFATEGTFDPKTHFFDVPPPKREEKKPRRRRVNPEEEVPPNTNRFAVMSCRPRHTNLSVVHYSVFFQMCRAHGIGYDIKEKQGTVFTLVDSYDRENLGMLTISDNLQGALATFARNLSVIHQEISAPNMQGDSNFKPVIEDIEAILGTTVQNADDADEDSNSNS